MTPETLAAMPVITAWIACVAAFFGLACVAAFVVRYWRKPWWMSETGRTIMLGALAICGLALTSAASWMGVALGTASQGAVRVVLAVMWVAVGIKYLVMRAGVRDSDRDNPSR